MKRKLRELEGHCMRCGQTFSDEFCPNCDQDLVAAEAVSPTARSATATSLSCVFCNAEIGRDQGYVEFYVAETDELTGLAHEECLEMVVDANGGPATFGYILGPDGAWCHESLWAEVWPDVDIEVWRC